MENVENIEELANSSQKEDFNFKLVIVGDCAVGKSNLLSRYIKNEFNKETKSTIGVELSTKFFKLNNKIIKLTIWDTAGQERFSSVTSAYYKGSHGAFVVYDITRKVTFENIDKWIKELKFKGSDNIKIILIGNKSDLFLLKKVSTKEGEEKAKKYNLTFFETSALDSNNIHIAFKIMTLEIYKNFLNENNKTGRQLNKNFDEDNNCGC